MLTALVKLVLRAVHTIRGQWTTAYQQRVSGAEIETESRMRAETHEPTMTSPVIVGRHGDPTAVKGIE